MARRMVVRMGSREDFSPRGELLEGGSARPPMLDRLSPRAIAIGVVVVALVSGVIGGGAVWWSHRTTGSFPPPPASDAAVGPELRLVLSGAAVRRSADRSGTATTVPLRIDAVLLHGRGQGSATVTRIHRPGNSLSIRASVLPVTLSAHHSFQRVRLELSPQDCTLATEWTPSSLPFVLTWEDERGDRHTELGGEHDASMELTLNRYVDSVCGNPHVR